MDSPILGRDQVARQFSITTATLLRYEGMGLIRPRVLEEDQGYGPAEIRRLWTILTFQRDLGINLAGVEVILRLRDEMARTQAHLERLARTLRDAFDEGGDLDAPP